MEAIDLRPVLRRIARDVAAVRGNARSGARFPAPAIC
jgi:hypothetical protein